MDVPGAHVPLPLQVRGVSVDPLHIEPQEVPFEYWPQAPLPLQSPLFPQLAWLAAGHCPLGAGLPAAIGPQTPFAPCPLAAAEQATHVPWHAASQHRPLTQWPEVHWSAAVQVAPLLCVGTHALEALQ
jgi:hypothetical protein